MRGTSYTSPPRSGSASPPRSGSAAHCGTSARACSCCPCAAGGGSAAERRAVLGSAVAGGSRAGYRSAEDLASRYSTATLVSRYAAGGTAGGSTDDRILLFVISADCGAARRHSSSWCWWRTKFWSSRFFLWTAFNSVAFQETHF